MDIRIQDWVGLSGIPLIQALVALVKTTMPSLAASYYPSISIAWGVALNLLLAYLLQSDLRIAAVVGLVAGLAASGLFAIAKSPNKPSP